jgi:hypothetical protein
MRTVAVFKYSPAFDPDFGLDVFDHFTFEFNHARKEIRVKQ